MQLHRSLRGVHQRGQRVDLLEIQKNKKTKNKKLQRTTKNNTYFFLLLIIYLVYIRVRHTWYTYRIRTVQYVYFKFTHWYKVQSEVEANMLSHEQKVSLFCSHQHLICPNQGVQTRQ